MDKAINELLDFNKTAEAIAALHTNPTLRSICHEQIVAALVAVALHRVQLHSYVLYADYGEFEGCSAPNGMVATEAEAQAWVDKEPNFNCYSEFTLGEIRK